MNIARTIAIQTSRKWRLTEYEDVLSELYLWLTIKASKGVLERYRHEQYGMQKLYVGMKRYATQYAIKEYELKTGDKLMPFNDKGEQYAYTIEQLNAALYVLWDFQDVIMTENNGKLQDIMLSLKLAFDKLNYAEQIILQYKYREGLTYKEIGQQLDCKEDAARMRIKRLVNRLQKNIG